MSFDTRFDGIYGTWCEVSRLEKGGFCVFWLDEAGSRRRPIYACTTIEELSAFLANFLGEPEPSPRHSTGEAA